MQMRLGIRPTVDFAFKKIFGTPENVPILLGLVNAVLQLRDPLVDVEILNPFSYQEFQDDKLIVLDIRARDAAGRWLNIEMQVSVYPGLLQRLAYYACALYVDQLQAGEHYTRLRPAISISLLNQVLFSDTPAAHHRFRLVDSEHYRALPESIQVHTVELTKYSLDEASIHAAPAIEQWAFFFLRADRYEPARLRELLPGEPFQRAITVLETIAAKREDRHMYDQREKAQRDYQWALDGARESGREEGREEGLQAGALVGKIQLVRRLLGEEEGSTDDLRQRSLEEFTALHRTTAAAAPPREWLNVSRRATASVRPRSAGSSCPYSSRFSSAGCLDIFVLANVLSLRRRFCPISAAPARCVGEKVAEGRISTRFVRLLKLFVVGCIRIPCQ
jgi:predicted transposase/invertase (TIGR01784 family)